MTKNGQTNGQHALAVFNPHLHPQTAYPRKFLKCGFQQKSLIRGNAWELLFPHGDLRAALSNPMQSKWLGPANWSWAIIQNALVWRLPVLGFGFWDCLPLSTSPITPESCIFLIRCSHLLFTLQSRVILARQIRVYCFAGAEEKKKLQDMKRWPVSDWRWSDCHSSPDVTLSRDCMTSSFHTSPLLESTSVAGRYRLCWEFCGKDNVCAHVIFSTFIDRMCTRQNVDISFLTGWFTEFWALPFCASCAAEMTSRGFHFPFSLLAESLKKSIAILHLNFPCARQ